MQVKKILAFGIDLIYPRRCPFCGQIAAQGEAKICPQCQKKLSYIKEPRCKKCSKPVVNSEQEYCYDCSKNRFSYERGIAVWLYKETVKQSIYQFKYHNKREYAAVYVEEIVRLYAEQILHWEADALVPIPIHKDKRNVRGFNQAELLANGIGELLQIPVVSNLIERNKNTLPQKGLNNTERKNNLKMAFKIAENGVKLRKIILVDDIYTTGATVDAVSKLLLDSGVSQVYFISVSIGEGY